MIKVEVLTSAIVSIFFRCCVSGVVGCTIRQSVALDLTRESCVFVSIATVQPTMFSKDRIH